MISADGIIHRQRQTLAYLEFSDAERPFGAQLFGSNPEIMARAAEIALSNKPDFIDINMGCPVKKVTKRKAGGALMGDISLSCQIVAEVKKVLLGSDCPLSVKFRSGLDLSNINFIDFGKAMQQAGADFITLHPRTVKQGFTGVSNWKHIKELKASLEIPVIGNGDVKSLQDAIDMRTGTGCDSIMIGRGVLGHPWMFKRIKDFFNNGSEEPIDSLDKLNTIIRHIDYALEIKPERIIVREIRSHLCYYTKGLKNSSVLRDKINHTDSISELKKLLTDAFIS